MFNNGIFPGRMFFHSPDAGGAGGGSGDDGKGDNDADKDEDAGTKKEFTQEELNKLFAERAKNARSAALKEVLTAMGVERLEDAQVLVKKAKDAEAANLSEVEKANVKVKELQSAHDTLAQQNKLLRMRQAFNDMVKELEIQFANLVAETDAFNAMDAKKIEEDDDGWHGIKEAVEAVVKERPYLVAEATAEPRQHNIDARSKGGHSLVTAQEAAVAKKRKSYSPL